MKKLLFNLGVIGGLLLGGSTAWATCDITSSFTAGQVLTAAQLNTLVTDSEACTNNVLNGDAFTGTMSFHSGSDAVGYSDAGSTKKWELDSATGDVIMSPRTIGSAINCEINYAAGTITISGRGGVALSATNPCHIGIRSTSSGVVATATFTANVTATDGAASQTDGNLFGITDANWASAMPMFVGVVYDGTTPYFTISRKPIVVTGSAAGDVCQLADTDCDGAGDVMILTTGLTLSSWVDLPITQVAWLSATYATTGGAWTFAESVYTGFNSLYETQTWTMVTNQNGAIGSTFLFVSGGDLSGDVPTWASSQGVYRYNIDRNGKVKFRFSTGAEGNCTNGDVAAILQLSLPYTSTHGGTMSLYIDVGVVVYGAAVMNEVVGVLDTADALLSLQNADNTNYDANGFSNAADDLYLSGEYNSL